MIDQIAIPVFTATQAFLVSKNDKYTKYASFFGMASQPFWFYATWTKEQYGMFALCFWFTYCWCRHFYNYWIVKGDNYV